VLGQYKPHFVKIKEKINDNQRFLVIKWLEYVNEFVTHDLLRDHL